MALIGMAEAARRAGVTSNGIRLSLQNAGVSLVRISDRAVAVEETDLERYLASRGGELRPGRPRRSASAKDEIAAPGRRRRPKGSEA